MAEKKATTTSVKNVSLSFGTEAELALYDALKSAAEADDRSISSFVVRVLLGKEQFPVKVTE